MGDIPYIFENIWQKIFCYVANRKICYVVPMDNFKGQLAGATWNVIFLKLIKSIWNSDKFLIWKLDRLKLNSGHFKMNTRHFEKNTGHWHEYRAFLKTEHGPANWMLEKHVWKLKIEIVKMTGFFKKVRMCINTQHKKQK